MRSVVRTLTYTYSVHVAAPWPGAFDSNVIVVCVCSMYKGKK